MSPVLQHVLYCCTKAVWNIKVYHMDFTVAILMFCMTALCKHFQSTKLNISLNTGVVNAVDPI